MEGQQLQPLIHNMANTGHKEFVYLAAKINKVDDIVYHYNKVLHLSHDGFIESKPPGSLLFYYTTKKLSGFFFHSTLSIKDTIRNIHSFAIIAWPFFSLLVLFPLYFFVKIFFKQKIALSACLLYIMIPSTNLVTMHLDQVLYPLLFILTLLTASYAANKNNIYFLFMVGVILYLSIYFTFGLLASTPFIVYIYLNKEQKILRLLQNILLTVLGFFFAYLLFFILFDYDAYTHYKKAITHSRSWNRAETFDFIKTLYSAQINFYEFSIFLGVPILILYATGFVYDLKNLFALQNHKNSKNLFLFSLISFGTILLMHLIQRNTGEVIRIWLFLTTLITARCAYIIHSLWKKNIFIAHTTIIVLQWFCILIIKSRHDF